MPAGIGRFAFHWIREEFTRSHRGHGVYERAY